MKKNKQSATVFIPVTNLNAIWSGTFEKLPPNKTYDLIIDYPLDKPAVFKIKSGKSGMNFIKLLGTIGKLYQKVYDKEDSTMKNKYEDRCYGIWGHDIHDLSLEGINVDHKKKIITLDIGS